MAEVDGVYDCVIKTPMGDQACVFSIISSGVSFQGTAAAPLGSMDVEQGKVDGNSLNWVMKMPMPMPMTLNCEAVVEGDKITGTIDTGAFGITTLTGTRRK